MERSFFAEVKQAIARSPESTLQNLGVELLKRVRGEWTQCRCPLCPDESGSASITVEGFLRCHQCGAKADVFEWLAEKEGQGQWEVCKRLAEQLGVNMTVKPARVRAGRWPQRMTLELLRWCIVELQESEQAAPLRRFLQERKLWHPAMLAELGVGAMQGQLIFAQWTEKGTLRARYRRYLPGGEPPWWWAGKGSGKTVGFWPLCKPAPEDGVIWLVEGEWDVFVAWLRLRLQDQGIYTFTWTGGAGQAPAPGDVPTTWRSHEVHVLYDNDVFQGPDWKKYRAPTDKQRIEMERRRWTLIEETLPTFVANGCNVFVRQIPIDPLKQWGADLRDWVDQGNRNLDELPCWSIEHVPPLENKTRDVDFQEVFDSASETVRFTCELSTIESDTTTIAQTSEIRCLRGQRNCCTACDIPSKFSDGLIHWNQLRRQQAIYLSQPSDGKKENYVLRQICGKPMTCPQAEVVPVPGRYVAGYKWWGVSVDAATNDSELMIISKDPPPLSGEAEVEGRVYSTLSSVVVMATKVTPLDKPEVDLEQHKAELARYRPAHTAESVESYLLHRATDFATNVTRIYGRPELHIAFDLLAHSALAFYYRGNVQRGWIDCCLIGDTRTGKSQTFRRMIEFTGLGQYHACMSNISRAGLVMGSIRGKSGRFVMKPGAWPKAHGKMLVLDEFHFMVECHRRDEHPMRMLQNARDEGKLHGLKMGMRSLPGKVRFCNIGNWARGDRATWRFACEHLLFLYGAPECLSRIDFGLAVSGPPEDDSEPDVDQHWTGELTRTLILRAWGQRAEDIAIDDDAIELAEAQCDEWKQEYCDELPLYTSEEKVLSILRIAISCANICFSTTENPYVTHVRIHHVEWACDWMRRCWRSLEYDSYSRIAIQRQQVHQPFLAEIKLSTQLQLEDPEAAASLLQVLIEPITMPELQTLLGYEQFDCTRWMSSLIRMNMFRKDRQSNGWSLSYKLSKGGLAIVKAMLTLAEDYPDEWVRRYRRLASHNFLVRAKGPDGLLPMNLPLVELRREWENSESESNLIEGPGA